MEPEVEVIQFRPPGPTTTLRLPLVLAPPDMEEPQVNPHFSWIESNFNAHLLHSFCFGNYLLLCTNTRCVKPCTKTSPSLDYSTASTLGKERRALTLPMSRFPCHGCHAQPHGKLFSIIRRELQVQQGKQQDQGQGASV